MTRGSTAPSEASTPGRAEPRADADEPDVRRAAPTIWGEDPRSLHDLFWASRCIEVVRPGSRDSVHRSGPALYLLLDRDQLVYFPIRAMLKRMHWASPRLLRLRIQVHDPIDYTEHVEQTESGVRFWRSYRRPVYRSERAWITADPDLALAWAGSGTAAEARRAVRSGVDRDAIESLVLDGESFDASDAREVGRWLPRPLEFWKRPNAVIGEIYEFQPGVWAHETAEVAPDARVLGPAWIGAGQSVGVGETLAGPVILPDLGEAADRHADRLSRVDWDIVRSPHWSLPGLTRRATLRRFIKRGFDIIFSLMVLCVTLPFYPFIMAAIWFEDGRPFFFAHARQTLGGRDFPCLKFRTMRRDAEQIKAELEAKNAADGPQFFIENDPRVTRTGNFLRKFQLDELPQFINVLLGHMSVVGPRPSPDKENQFCPAWREARLSVRPGITGLWQVSRTRMPQTDFQEWIRYDLEYVQHQSFVGDLRIIIDTVRQIIKI